MAIKEELARIIGIENVKDEPETLEIYSRDESFVQPIRPSCVVKLKNMEEVQEIIRWAKDSLTPLVPISSGPPHFRGDTVPGQGGTVIVDLSNLKKIIRVDRLNRVAQLKPAMYLRGIENIFMDLAMREEIAHAIFRKIRKFYLVYLERILKAAKGKIDIVLTGDDFGSQNGLLISADMWRNFIKPGFAEYISLIKNHGARAMHHTCGSVVEIIPELIKCGLDVLQSIQPEAVNMSLAELKTKFGQMLCFHGGISIQKTMPFGSADEVRQEVKKIADIIKPDGGYIFCTSHNIQSDTCIENVQALMEAYRGYGRY